jgi:hypothetical protein
MAHGGQPELGSNPFVGIDATGLQVIDAEGADNFVLPAGTPFKVAMQFTLGGSFAPFLVGLPINYTVSYSFSGRGVPDGPTVTTGPVPTIAGQLAYADPNTTANVLGLPAGLYELSAAVTFGGSPPMAAFIDFPVIEVF